MLTGKEWVRAATADCERGCHLLTAVAQYLLNLLAIVADRWRGFAATSAKGTSTVVGHVLKRGIKQLIQNQTGGQSKHRLQAWMMCASSCVQPRNDVKASSGVVWNYGSFTKEEAAYMRQDNACGMHACIPVSGVTLSAHSNVFAGRQRARYSTQ